MGAVAPATAEATSGPVAACGFEDATVASAGDSSGFGNTGTVQGAGRVPGRHGTGLSFDGVDDVVHVAYAGPLSLASGSARGDDRLADGDAEMRRSIKGVIDEVRV